MRISEFVHGITNPELIKRLHDKIPKTVDEIIRVTTSFLPGELAASNHEREKSFPPWKQQEGNQKENFRKGSFQNQQRPERKQDRFTLLTKTPNRQFRPRKREIQSSATNEDSGRKAESHQILRVLWANTTTGEDWRRRTLRFGLYEFRGRKVIISIITRIIGRTRSQKLSSGSIIGLTNAENPSRRRNNYPKKQATWIFLLGSLRMDMTGVLRHIVEHRLNVREGCSPVRQKRRGQAADRNQAIQEEVRKVVEEGIMKEVHYHD
ncbi:hypothetical protein Tco_0868502 [Tanacetum coccineum]